MSLLRRTALVFAALTIAAVGFAVPASASSHDTCVTQSGAVNAVQASLMPTTVVAEDVAFNYDDPDAEDNPLALIEFPSDAVLWISARIASPDSILGETYVAGSATDQEVDQVAERTDRPVSDSIVRLYCGLLDRKPSSFELDYWASRYWNGLPLVTIAEAFTHSSEFVNAHGVVADEELVTLLYRQVLGRAPGPGAVRAIASRIESGEMHRGHAVVQITESGEYVKRTGTVAPEKPILPYPDVGSGRRIIYTNGGQRVWLINDTGELHKTHQVSGRRGIPSVGRYRIYSMSRYAWAPYDGITMEYMVRFARGEWPYGFHSIPVRPGDSPMQTPAQLGTHRSGGCVRQLWDDAQAVYEWSTIGTRVIVTP